MKKAIITIEVLISLLILFLVITTSFSNLKFLNILNVKKENYEEYYTTLSSLKDKVSDHVCRDPSTHIGKFNSYSYNISCEQKEQLRTFVLAGVENEREGNIGNTTMTLYLVKLTLLKNDTQKEYTYYKTISEKIK